MYSGTIISILNPIFLFSHTRLSSLLFVPFHNVYNPLINPNFHMKTTLQVLSQYHQVHVPTRELIETQAKYYAPQNPDLFISGMHNLIVALKTSDAIFRDQFHPPSAQAYAALNDMQQRGAFLFNSFPLAMAVSGSLYDAFTEEHIEPDFTMSDLHSHYATTKHQSTLTLPELTTLLFYFNETPSLPSARGFYPQEINGDQQEALLAKIKADPQLKSHYTKVILKNDTLTAIPFTEHYKEQLTQVSHSTTQALNKFQALLHHFEPEKRDGLQKTIQFLQEQDAANNLLDSDLVYASSDRARVHAFTTASPAPFLLDLGFGNLYRDPFKLKMVMAGTLSLETAQCRNLQPFVQKFLNTQALEKNIPYTPAIRSFVPPVPVLMHDAIYRSGAYAIGPQAIAATLISEDNNVNNQEGVVIVALRNILDAKAQIILNPIAQTILPQEKIQQYEPNFANYLGMAFSIGIMSHEQRHFIGEQQDQKQLQELLGELFYDICEGTAEIGRVYSFREISAQGYDALSPINLETFLYDTYFTDMFRHLRFGPKSPYRRSAEWRLNYFIQHGSVELNDHIQITDYDQFKQATTQLYALHLEILHTGNAHKAKEFISHYTIEDGSPLDTKRKSLVDTINNKNIPRDIMINYVL